MYGGLVQLDPSMFFFLVANSTKSVQHNLINMQVNECLDEMIWQSWVCKHDHLCQHTGKFAVHWKTFALWKENTKLLSMLTIIDWINMCVVYADKQKIEKSIQTKDFCPSSYASKVFQIHFQKNLEGSRFNSLGIWISILIIIFYCDLTV